MGRVAYGNFHTLSLYTLIFQTLVAFSTFLPDLAPCNAIFRRYVLVAEASQGRSLCLSG